MFAVRSRALSLYALSALCFSPSLALAEWRPPTHVACVGDSITYGYAASSSAKSYPSVLQSLFGAQVKVGNFGHNGATLLTAPYGDTPYVDQSEYQAANAFISGAGASAVVDVVILLGTNDSKPANWTPPSKPKNDQQFLSDYRALVEHFLALTPKPVLYLGLPLATGNDPCCSIDGTVIHDQILPLIKQVAQEKQLPIIDLNTPTSGHPEYFNDGVHPTDAGYALVAGLVHDGLLAMSGAAGGGASGSAGSSSVGGGSGGAPAGGASGGAGAAHVAGSGNIAGSGNVAGSGNIAGSAAVVANAGATSAGAVGAGGASSGGASVPTPSRNSPSSGCSVTSERAADGPAFGAAALLALSWLGLRRRRPSNVLQARQRS